MPRIPQLTPDAAEADRRDLLEATRKQLGRVPNFYASLANGPAALRGYLALRDALTGGVLGERLREQLALLIAQENGCLYCVSAHTMRGGRLLRMTDDELLATRRAEDADPHARAVLQVAAAVVREHGRVDDELLARARKDGVTDAELAEIVAHVALNTLSNYFNHLAEPDLDFPAVASMDPAQAPAQASSTADLEAAR
ncbi:carboxymuconolactone decarboxylase family protein [Kitasatospora sp. CM 4170]|uniref:Carboxymuconolactone decarboxylase family protein n=1 Tax=Kitasatospora aburaviensis TaxID=67265 RepID=A0ABW1F7X2_9ACTN|nr:carboxymuconolactone decarboxylase family protein [Kitasatospora sp. CM 4170]WNM49873.1 carboxymuconolactone decarboxylase family protein [Kitasatospora sp. CM 4170]